MDTKKIEEWINKAKHHVKTAGDFKQIGHLQKRDYHINKAEIILNALDKHITEFTDKTDMDLHYRFRERPQTGLEWLGIY